MNAFHPDRPRQGKLAIAAPKLHQPNVTATPKIRNALQCFYSLLRFTLPVLNLKTCCDYDYDGERSRSVSSKQNNTQGKKEKTLPQHTDQKHRASAFVELVESQLKSHPTNRPSSSLASIRGLGLTLSRSTGQAEGSALSSDFPKKSVGDRTIDDGDLFNK
ncbi:hypothetical protein RP20_CCG006352 [Aedes albopictus]|nr:hypothetical protein RP20_CCG006352 [Aedes albopictus]